MEQKKKKMSDVTKMVIAMVLGSIVGLVVGEPATQIGFIGDMWLNLMKMFLVPIVVCMLVKGISSMDDPKTLGRLGVRFTVFYLFTTACAALIGAGMPLILNLGSGFQYTPVGGAGAVQIKAMPSIQKFFLSMFSTNMFGTFSKGDMMQVLVISCFIGVAIVLLPTEKREPVRQWFFSMADLVMSLINIAMKLAPYGVFCLMASTMGKHGMGVLVTIAQILGAFYAACLIQIVIIYCVVPFLAAQISPVSFLKKSFPVTAAAISTCSSNAVLPVSVETAKKNFNVSDVVASLGVPLGATVNKDGVAVLCGVVLIFSANAMGMPLSMAQIANLIFATVLVTSAGSGVPGGGLMNLMIVATAIGMPLDIVVMVGGFYRFFDMGTTTVNCLGTLSGTVLIDRLEKKFNKVSLV